MFPSPPPPPPRQECDPENQKVRQKLKAKEWDELITKGKRFRILQPVKIGCIWEGEEAGACADLKLLQQFTASILDTSIADEEQVEKSNQKKTKDQQSKRQVERSNGQCISYNECGGLKRMGEKGGGRERERGIGENVSFPP